MILFKHSKDLENYLDKQRQTLTSIGFVPTMGALHSGHLSLINKCKSLSQLTVCSIFVNPTQFNNQDDFEKYPKTMDEDVLLLEENGCDVLFMPDEIEIYPNAASREKHYDLGYLETILEGKFRPGHFQGVCLVVEKLLKAVNPDRLFIGQKDFQQCMVIRRLIELMHEKIEVVICPILREENGLAMSSRNRRLSASQKESAAELHRQLVWIRDQLTPYHFQNLKKEAMGRLKEAGFKVEYLELAKSGSLDLINEFENDGNLIILVAAFMGDVRLIDNLLISE